MILYRREAVLKHHPYLMPRDDEGEITDNVPTSTLIVAIVLGVVGLLLLIGEYMISIQHQHTVAESYTAAQ
jgi:hypothetical protein